MLLLFFVVVAGFFSLMNGELLSKSPGCIFQDLILSCIVLHISQPKNIASRVDDTMPSY